MKNDYVIRAPIFFHSFTLSFFHFLVIILFTGNSSYSLDYQWVRQGGGAGDDIGRAATHDHVGNIIITGEFTNTAVFGSDTIISQSPDTNDIFLVKYASDGSVIWAKHAGSNGFDGGLAIATDVFDNILVGGFFSGKAWFDGDSVVSIGSLDLFIAKYNPNGVLLWVRSAGGSSIDRANGISADTAGNVFITGQFTSDCQFDSILLIANGGLTDNDIFIAKYSSNGNLLWVKSAGGVDYDEGDAVVANVSGEVYVTGSFRVVSHFDADSLQSVGGADIFLAKYDPNGNIIWVKRAGGPNDDGSRGVTLDPIEFPCITGNFHGSGDFDGNTQFSRGDDDVFIARYNTTGNNLWVHHHGGYYWDYGYAIAADNSGGLYMTGLYDGTALFNADTVIGGGMFVVKYDTAGNYHWLQHAQGTAFGNGITALASDAIYVTGNFFSTIGFNFISLTDQGLNDVFLARIDEGFTGISKNNAASAFSFYSDPIGDGIYIYMNPLLEGDYTLNVFDLSGRAVIAKIIFEEVFQKRTYYLRVENIPKGIYIISLSNKERRFSARWIKE